MKWIKDVVIWTFPLLLSFFFPSLSKNIPWYLSWGFKSLLFFFLPFFLFLWFPTAVWLFLSDSVITSNLYSIELTPEKPLLIIGFLDFLKSFNYSFRNLFCLDRIFAGPACFLDLLLANSTCQLFFFFFFLLI